MLQVESINLVPLSGFTFNAEEKTTLMSSLQTLKHANQLDKVLIWGKIFGTQKDYLLAIGWKNSKIFDQTVFFSLDSGLNWGILQSPTQKETEVSAKISRRFIGDPAYISRVGEDQINEERRLSATVNAITSEVAIVPRGAYYKDQEKTVRANPSFGGLSEAASSSLGNYLHFKQTVGEFETIEKDQPKGCWSVKKDQSSQFVVLNSLNWPGFVAFAGVNSPQYGQIYFGTGQKNNDLGFML